MARTASMRKQGNTPAFDFPAPYVSVNECYQLLGFTTYQTARNALYRKRFPVPTYLIGKRRVIDRDVLAAFFNQKRAECMTELTRAKKQKASRA